MNTVGDRFLLLVVESLLMIRPFSVDVRFQKFGARFTVHSAAVQQVEYLGDEAFCISVGDDNKVRKLPKKFRFFGCNVNFLNSFRVFSKQSQIWLKFLQQEHFVFERRSIVIQGKNFRVKTFLSCVEKGKNLFANDAIHYDIH